MAPVDSRDYVLSGIYYSVLVLVYTQNISITFVQCVEDVGPALYKWFVFAENNSWSGGDYKPTPTQCLLNVGPQS